MKFIAVSFFSLKPLTQSSEKKKAKEKRSHYSVIDWAKRIKRQLMENIIKCSYPKMTGQNDRPDESLTGQVHDQAGHCPLTGRYFEPCSLTLNGKYYWHFFWVFFPLGETACPQQPFSTSDRMNRRRQFQISLASNELCRERFWWSRKKMSDFLVFAWIHSTKWRLCYG